MKRIISLFLTLAITVTSSPTIIEANELPSDATLASANTNGANAGSITPPGSGNNNLFTGSFNYSIPIEVPPGINGMEPDISLQYTSTSEDGWLGMGWDLSLGNIRRSTKEGLPSYDNQDTFILTLKGQTQELVPIPNTSPQEYRAKIEGAFMKFTKQSSGDYWVVYDKTGKTYVFGQRGDSRLINPNNTGVYLWALDQIEDLNKNYMTLWYQQPSGENQIYPYKIEYGGNYTTSRNHDREINFNITSSLIKDLTYAPGFLSQTHYMLDSITSYVDGNQVWKDEIVYSSGTNTGRCLLKSIQRTGLDGSTKYPARTFDYQAENISQTYDGPYTLPDGNWDHANVNFIVGDWNGDGKQDYAVYRPKMDPTDWSYGSELYTSNGDGTFDYKGPIPGIDWTFHTDKAVTGDFNGDGKTDLIVFRHGTTTHFGKVLLSNGDGSFTDTAPYPWTGFSDPYQHIFNSDFNGDGLTDTAFYKFDPNGGGTSGVYLSDGDGTFTLAGGIPGNDWTSVTDKFLTGDFNGDKNMDIAMYRNSSNDGFSSIYFSDGDGTFTYIDRIPAGNFTSAENLVVAGDLNRDNLTDLIVWRETQVDGVGTSCLVHLSKGNGEFELIGSVPIVPTPYDPGRSFIQIAELNGDGNRDLIVYGNRDIPNSGTFSAHHFFGYGDGSFVHRGPIPRRYWIPEEPIWGDWKLDKDHVIFMDFTGDGRSDYLLFRTEPPSSGAVAYKSSNFKPDLMSSINNGIGGETKITYKKSSDYSNTLLPFSIQTVESITQLDGHCDPNLNECMKTNFLYEGGFFDLAEKEFLGFSKVSAMDAAGNKTVTHFHQKWDKLGNPVVDNAFKGRAYLVEKYDSNEIKVSEQETFWEYTDPYPNEPIRFVRTEKTKSTSYESSPNPITEVSYLYDDSEPQIYGRVTQVDYKGDPADPNDDRKETIEYEINTSKYIVTPKLTQIFDSDGITLVSKTEIYDSIAAGANPPNHYSEVKNYTDVDASTFIQSKVILNDYGQPEESFDFNGGTTTYTYDVKQFRASVTNPANFVVSTTHDPKTGNILTNTDINGITTTYEYDVLGRLSKIIGPNDTSGDPTVLYDYHDELRGNPSVQFIEEQRRERHGQSDVIWNKTYIDGLGRTHKVEQEAKPGDSIMVDTRYNNRGLVYTQTLPYRNSNPIFYNTVNTYDSLGRTTHVTTPDQNTTTTFYEGRTTRVQDANGNIQISESDAFGRIIKRYEPSISNPTTYAYDTLGNLTQIQDSQGKITSFEYDSLGRKLKMIDPNAGEWNYKYDDNGNLIEQIDARDVKLTFTYDSLNRPLTKIMADDPNGKTGQSNGLILASYSYDETLNRLYSKGQLTSVSDPSGVTRFYHDNLGRVTKEEKEIDSTVYTTTTTYDAMGRVTQLDYPSDETVKYNYDSAGRLSSVTNGTGSTIYASYPTYNALGQPLVFNQNNSLTKTTYSYDPQTTLLSSLKTEDMGASQVLQEMTYNFDAIGNITQIDDKLDSNKTQNFEYDSLYRIQKADGIYGEQTYSYDDLGNFNHKGTKNYKYEDANHPYAVTEVTPQEQPAVDNSTIIAWDLNSNEPIYSLSGIVKSQSSIALSSVSVVLSGSFNQAVKTNSSGEFFFTGLSNDEFSVFVSSPGYLTSPAGFPYNPLNQSLTDLDFTLSVDPNTAINESTLRLPRYSFSHGGPTPHYQGGNYDKGVVGGVGYGGQISTGGNFTNNSGYSTLPDANDVNSQPTAQALPIVQTSNNHSEGPELVTGRYNQALKFDGENDVFVFPDSNDKNLPSFTVMSWVKPSTYSISGFSPLISKSTASAMGQLKSGFRVSLDSARKIVFELGGTNGSTILTSNQSLPENSWRFVSLTYDGSEMKIYINNSLDKSISYNGGYLSNTYAITLASQLDEHNTVSPNNSFSGIIDEPRIHNRAWSLEEIIHAYDEFSGLALFTYDANGNCDTKVQGDENYSFQYNGEGQLANISLNGQNKASFVYDFNGNRVKKTIDGQTTVYVGNIFEKRPDNSKVSHIMAGSIMLCDIIKPTSGPSQGINYHQDHQNSITIVTDDGGTKQQDLSYMPFGFVYASNGPSLTNHAYTSQEFESELGVYFYKNRYYDASVGRFISPDRIIPNIQAPQTLNPYAYVVNNPINLIDPTGNIPEDAPLRDDDRFFDNPLRIRPLDPFRHDFQQFQFDAFEQNFDLGFDLFDHTPQFGPLSPNLATPTFEDNQNQLAQNIRPENNRIMLDPFYTNHDVQANTNINGDTPIHALNRLMFGTATSAATGTFVAFKKNASRVMTRGTAALSIIAMAAEIDQVNAVNKNPEARRIGRNLTYAKYGISIAFGYGVGLATSNPFTGVPLAIIGGFAVNQAFETFYAIPKREEHGVNAPFTY